MQRCPPIAQRIIEIQKEISRINVHQREHMAGSGGSVQLDHSCSYCQARLDHESWIMQANKSTVDDDSSGRVILNELERTVDLAGKKGQVNVPRNWAGKKVKIMLL